MNILDISKYTPLSFNVTQQPETYDFEKPERLLALLKQVVVHPKIELLTETYELVYVVYPPANYIHKIDAYGNAVEWIGGLEPMPTRVSLRPRLFLLCLRCPDLHHDNQVHARELIRHLEAEIMRRKLQALLGE